MIMAVIEKKTVNGVDTGAVESFVNAIKGNKNLAKFKFRLHNKWVDGAFNQATVGKFYGSNQENDHLTTFTWDADEPPALAGQDRGANPVEHLLAALAACLTTTMVYHAAIRDIKIEELESELDGDIDLRGLLGMDPNVRSGFQNIRVNFRVKTGVGNIEKLKAFSKLSPVFDVTNHGTKVNVTIEKK
jgi:uncharacterized OsmC-like protein